MTKDEITYDYLISLINKNEQTSTIPAGLINLVISEPTKKMWIYETVGGNICVMIKHEYSPGAFRYLYFINPHDLS